MIHRRSIAAPVRIGLIVSAAFLFLSNQGYAVVVIGSFDGTRSARPFTGSDHDNIRADLLNPANFGPAGTVTESVSIAPGISSATAAALSGTDVFVLSEADTLSGAEVTALANFVASGNCLVLVSDSATGRFGANAMLQALDGGSIADPTGGNTGAAVGTFVASTATTNGPFGNLVGGTFAATLAGTLNAGANSTVIGHTSGDTFDVLLEIPEGSLGPGSGAVLAMSDVLLMDFFVPPADLFDNANNSRMFLNFVAHCASDVEPSPVPEPSTFALAALGLLSLARRRLLPKRGRAA